MVFTSLNPTKWPLFSQNGLFDLNFTLSILTDLIRPLKGKRYSSRLQSSSVLTIRAMETLGTILPQITEGIEDVFDNVLTVAARSASHHSWGEQFILNAAVY
jgi:hypothetical protein